MLRLILGKAGTGKTTAVMAAIRRAVEAKRPGQILLVPEQYSHEAERELCAACGDSLSLYGEVFSFTGLARRLMSELGGGAAPWLDKGGRLLCMALALANVAPRLRVYGAAAHKVELQALLLRELGAEGPVATLAEAVGLESDGKSLGCACRDDVSKALTCNMGILRLENGEWYGTLDMRCPVTADQEKLKKETAAHLPGIRVTVDTQKPPHHVPADSELVTALLASYEEETGLKGEPISTGGGTYAKVLKQGVAFGALFPDEEDLAHQADEYEDIDRLMLAMKIYANALIRLAG